VIEGVMASGTGDRFMIAAVLTTHGGGLPIESGRSGLAGGADKIIELVDLLEELPTNVGHWPTSLSSTALAISRSVAATAAGVPSLPRFS